MNEPCPKCNYTLNVFGGCLQCGYQSNPAYADKPEIFNCKYYKEDYQSVPVPFGVGSCSEPIGDCAIESESEDCTLECPDYSACKPDLTSDLTGEEKKELYKDLPEYRRAKPEGGELTFKLYNKDEPVGHLRLKDGWTQFCKLNQPNNWVYPCPFKWTRYTCAHIERVEERLKKMYAGDLSPESRLNGYSVVLKNRNKRIEQLQADVTRLEGEQKKIIDIANEHGWNGVENSKILSEFLKAELTRLRWIPVEKDIPPKIEAEKDVVVYSPDFIGSKFILLEWYEGAYDGVCEMTHYRYITLPEGGKDV